MKDYKKVIKQLQPFLELHHMDIHDRFDRLEAQFARIESKLDSLTLPPYNNEISVLGDK